MPIAELVNAIDAGSNKQGGAEENQRPAEGWHGKDFTPSARRRTCQLFMRARVDGAIKHSPQLKALYEQIKRGTIKNLSVGGFFSRVETALGPRINAARLIEVSATSTCILPHGMAERPVAFLFIGMPKDLVSKSRKVLKRPPAAHVAEMRWLAAGSNP
jgi:hypothetical protein